MDFIKRLFKGFIIGSGAILPGISSGVLCVIFGIYQSIVEAVLGIFKDFRKNFFYLLPIGIGGILGMVLFGNVLLYLLNHYPLYLKSSFIGLILGSIPALWHTTYKNESHNSKNSLFILLSFAFAIFLVCIEKFNLIPTDELSSPSFLYLLFSGFLMSIGIVVPGVSSTILLMLLGVYSTYLSAISDFNLPLLIPLSIGAFCGCLIFLKCIHYLLEHHYYKTFSCIIGFTLGSIFVIFPGFCFDFSHFLAIRTNASFLCINIFSNR